MLAQRIYESSALENDCNNSICDPHQLNPGDFSACGGHDCCTFEVPVIDRHAEVDSTAPPYGSYNIFCVAEIADKNLSTKVTQFLTTGVVVVNKCSHRLRLSARAQFNPIAILCMNRLGAQNLNQ